MVTRSPFSAWVKSMASADGPLRSGAMASDISNSLPATKRAASILPSRYFAASACPPVVRRGSSIAFPEQFVDRARGLAFAPLGARRLGRWRPAVDIDMKPGLFLRDHAHQ